MTDDPKGRSPLAHRRADLAAFAAAGGGVTVTEVPFLAQVAVRAAADDAPALVPRAIRTPPRGAPAGPSCGSAPTSGS